ncbi:hypothetical protein [Anaplasma bovis]|uniref:hypothetical protein n=1 Tax=Anaplasma bovis TaxID=186733 RepID=UPI002FEF7E6C
MVMKYIYKNFAFVTKSAFIASIGILFVNRWAFARLDKKKMVRSHLYSGIREKHGDLVISKCFLERRVRNYFSLFCAQGKIEISDLSRQIQVANLNENSGSNLRNIDLVMSAFWAGLACVLIALKVFPGKHGSYKHDTLFVSFLFVFAVLTVFNFGFWIRCGRVVEVSRKEFERLDSELKREYAQYSGIIRCVEIYNTLPSEVKSCIKRSDHLSKMVEEKILSCRLTEEEAKKIERRVIKLGIGSGCMCA